MTHRHPLLISFLLLSSIALSVAGSPTHAAVPDAFSPADSSGARWFFPDSLWADAAALDSARVYRDSLSQAMGGAERMSTDPLAAGRTATSFNYNTSYQIGQSNTSWTNSAQFSMQANRVVLTNATDITLDRYIASGTVSPRQQRNSATDLFYRFNPSFSLGGKANLYRFLSSASGIATADREDKNEFSLSAKATKLHPTRFATMDLNMSGGYLADQKPTYQKNGLSGDINGTFAANLSRLANLTLNGQANGNKSLATVSDTSSEKADTRDLSRVLRGTLALIPGHKVSANVNGSKRVVQTQSPLTQFGPTVIQEILTRSGDLTAALQGRFTAERYFSFSGRLANEDRGYSVQTSQSSGRNDKGWQAEAHDLRWAFKMDASLSNGFTTNDFSQRQPLGYIEDVHNRILDLTVQRPIGRRLNLKAEEIISLSSYRYNQALVDGDQYRQLFSAEARYNPGQRWNTTLSYQQELRQTINLHAADSGRNLEDQNYQLTWSWSYRLSEGLTASQRNTVSSNYQHLMFAPDSSGLRLEYYFVTTLEASIIPNRLRVTLTHSTRYQPSGVYKFDGAEGRDLFFKSDESRFFSLDSKIAYSPTSWLTLNLNPVYQRDMRLGAQGDELVLLNSGKNLRLSGGATVRRPVGTHGSVSGDLSRQFVADQRVPYASGVPAFSAVAETDYWQGRLDFTWTY